MKAKFLVQILPDDCKQSTAYKDIAYEMSALSINLSAESDITLNVQHS